jgi:hypothetical protein
MALGVLLLPLFVAVDTSRALVAFALLNSGASLSSSLITFVRWLCEPYLLTDADRVLPQASELCKLAVACTAALYLGKSFLLPPPTNATPSRPSTLAHVTPYLRFAIPAALYAINTIMFLEGLRITQPALLQVTVLSKVRFAFSYPPTTQKRRLSS